MSGTSGTTYSFAWYTNV